MKTPVLLLALALAGSAAGETVTSKLPEIKEHYDEVSDLGAFTASTVLTKYFADYRLNLTASLVYKGQPGKSNPLAASLTFSNSVPISKGWIFLKSHTFRALINEKRDAFETDHDGDASDGDLYETMITQVPVEFLERMANSDGAKYTLGGEKFEISPEGRLALGLLLAKGVPKK